MNQGQDRIELKTPDKIPIDLELAGLGSRVVAGFYDIIFMYLVLILSMIALSYFSFGTGEIFSAVFVLLLFALIWGYNIFFEVLNNGQTPGKMIVGTQVVTDQGLSVNWKDSMIRNVCRVADWLPLPVFLGGISMVISGKTQRLGDYAAGTIVIRKEKAKKKTSWLAVLQENYGKPYLPLPCGVLHPNQLASIEELLMSRKSLDPRVLEKVVGKFVTPLIKICGKNPEDFVKFEKSIQLLEEVLKIARTKSFQAISHEKEKVWNTYEQQMKSFLKEGSKAVRSFSVETLQDLWKGFREVVSGLMQARAARSDETSLVRLNRLALEGNQFFYGSHYRLSHRQTRISPIKRFIFTVQSSWRAVFLASCLFIIPSIISYVAVQSSPDLAYQLVSESFFDFEPANVDNMHDIPSVSRPVAASSIMTNNIQVTFLAFAGGLLLGIGTSYILIFNGLHLGAVAGWMAVNGNERALWGWIMPHGFTEIFAIILAGAAGLMIAEVLLNPGKLSRTQALKQRVKEALVIEMGCFVMLVFAGLIEGFISPSSLSFDHRILFLSATVLFWACFFLPTGLSRKKNQ